MSRRSSAALRILALLLASGGQAHASTQPDAAFANLPLKRDAQEADAISLWAALALLVPCGAVAVWAQRRRARRPGDGLAPKVSGSTSLGPHGSLHVVEWGGERLLIACNAHAISVVSREAAPLEEPGS